MTINFGAVVIELLRLDFFICIMDLISAISQDNFGKYVALKCLSFFQLKGIKSTGCRLGAGVQKMRVRVWGEETSWNAS